MENKIKKNACKCVAGVFILLMILSCKPKNSRMESPLAIVVKLISAESLADFEQAKKYIDVEKVYAGHPDSLSAEQAWRDKVTFFYNLGRDKKITNVFKYYNYNITEEQNGGKAKVIFEASNSDEQIPKIVYTLTIRKNAWIVSQIEYQKRNK